GLGLVMIVLLAQAAAAARVGIFGWRPPYAGWLLISVALIGASLLVFKSPAGAIAGGAGALLVLGLVVFGSERLPLD
ncbi:MAG: hypothetical protein MUC34_21065, partial [Anaerolineae bacterium]|nr:hypothetical protein [Anaerolineae bacterium]